MAKSERKTLYLIQWMGKEKDRNTTYDLFDESQETAQINVPKIGRRLST
jgi:hypothetical protein